ncbi:MAG: SDR family oxidoreductase [Proteobacteria bacterium]|nr:SDR family oxidoreductase [Pseudomonadota bacterium]
MTVQRVGKTTDVAKAVAFLIHNSFVNGTILVVDGGHHLI